MKNAEFEKIWGKVLYDLKEQGKRSIYAEARDVKNGHLTETEAVAYIRSKSSLLFEEQNKNIIEEILRFHMLKEVKFVPEERDEEKIKLNNLKKLFGDSLEIL